MAVAAAAIAVSVGYMGNDMNLSMIQSMGIGETDLVSPVQLVDVSIRVDRTFGLITADFKDFIVDCVFSSPNQVDSGSTLICKLVSGGDNVVAEGRKVLSTDLLPNSPTVIPIDMTSFENSNNIDSIVDIILIVQGPPQP
jgi:hypothetical protein